MGDLLLARILKKEARCRERFLRLRHVREAAHARCVEAFEALQAAKREAYEAGFTGNVMRDENGDRVTAAPTPQFLATEDGEFNGNEWPEHSDEGLVILEHVSKYPHGTYFGKEVPEGTAVVAYDKAVTIIAAKDDLIDKYKWQVRDTCVRAEKAEANNTALTARVKELEELYKGSKQNHEKAFNAAKQNGTEVKSLETQLSEALRGNRYAQLEQLSREKLNEVVDAWESLPGGLDYRKHVMQQWISGPMKGAIDNIRSFLGRKMPE